MTLVYDANSLCCSIVFDFNVSFYGKCYYVLIVYWKQKYKFLGKLEMCLVFFYFEMIFFHTNWEKCGGINWNKAALLVNLGKQCANLQRVYSSHWNEGWANKRKFLRSYGSTTFFYIILLTTLSYLFQLCKFRWRVI